ncbi:MAG: branched-chain amino acid ABC transporter permease, partial [Pseudohongiellaceae bacterium]
DESVTFFDAYKEIPYLEIWWGETGSMIIDWAVPLSIFMAIPVMLLIGLILERGLYQFFYKRTHAEQILVTFGLAIVIQEVIKTFYGANPIPTPAPEMLSGAAPIGVWLGLGESVAYPYWRLVYFLFSLLVIGLVFAFLRYTTFGMVVRAGMSDRETVSLLGLNVERRFTILFGIASVVAGLAGVMYTPIVPPDYHMGMEFLVLSFVVVVVGGMGSLPGAVAAGFLLGILQSFASMNEIKSLLPGLDQIIVYLIAVIVLLVRPRGLMGQKGVMED